MAPPKQSRVNAERRARVEEMQREQRRRERRVRVLITGGGSLVGLAIIAVIVVAALNRHSPEGRETLPSPVPTDAAVTTEPAATTVANKTGIDGVTAYDTSGHVTTAPTTDGKGLPYTHVDGPVKYSVTPPVGGDHNQVWMNCGVYNAPVPNERAVHNLEHGAIWITYEPSLPSSEVAQLKSLVLKQKLVQPGQDPSPERFMDLTPWADNSIGSPIVVSAWGYQLKVSSPTDPRIQKFIDTFRVNPTYTPELGSPCSGEPVTEGGNPIAS